MNSLAKLTNAKNVLAECKTLPDVLKIRDMAEAARTYAKAAQESLEIVQYAGEIKLRAERKAGLMLNQMQANGTIPCSGRTLNGSVS